MEDASGSRRGRRAGKEARRVRSPAREERAPPRGDESAARDRGARKARAAAENRRMRVVAPPPKSVAVEAAQAVLQSLGFSDAYEAFVALDEQATNAVSMAELRKGLRVLKIEQLDEVIAEIRSFRALVAHHNDAIDGRTFFGVLDWSQPAKGFSHRSLNAAYRRRHRILETFRQNLPKLLRERARREEQQLRERAREEEQRKIRDLMPAPPAAEEERRYRRPASPRSPSSRRAAGRRPSPSHMRAAEDGLIDILRSASGRDSINPYGSQQRGARDEDTEQHANELRTGSRQMELRQDVIETAAVELHQSLGPFLRLFGLERYHGRLVHYGVERVPDLLVMEDADYVELDIKPLHMRRFQAVIEGIEIGTQQAAESDLSTMDHGQGFGALDIRRGGHVESSGIFTASSRPEIESLNQWPPPRHDEWKSYDEYGLSDPEMTAAERSARMLFAEFDTDQTGRLVSAEVHAALCALGVPLTHPELQTAMQSMDETGEGRSVGCDRFISFWSTRQPHSVPPTGSSRYEFNHSTPATTRCVDFSYLQQQQQQQQQPPPPTPSSGTPLATPSQHAAAKQAWAEDRSHQQHQGWYNESQAPTAQAPAAASTASIPLVPEPESEPEPAPVAPTEAEVADLHSDLEEEKAKRRAGGPNPTKRPGNNPGSPPPPPPPPPPGPPPADFQGPSADGAGKSTNKGPSDDAGGRNDLLAAIRKGTGITQRTEDPSARGVDAKSSPASVPSATPAPAPDAPPAAPSAPPAPPAPKLPMDLQASIQQGKQDASTPQDETSKTTASPPTDLQTSTKSPKATGKPPAAPPPPPADYVPRSQRSGRSAKQKPKAQEKKQSAGEDTQTPALPLDLQASIKQGKKSTAIEDQKAKAGSETAAAPKLPVDLQASIKKGKEDGGDEASTAETKKKKKRGSKLADNWMKNAEPEPEPEPEPESASTRELLIDGTAVEFAHARFGASNCDLDVTAVAVEPIKANDFIDNQSHLAGNIAVAERGEITFVEKAIRIQNAGAVAALFVNTDDQLFTLDGGPDDQDVKMPIVFVRARDGVGLLSKPSSGSWPSCKLRFPARQLCDDDDDDQEPFNDGIKKKGKLQIGGFNPLG